MMEHQQYFKFDIDLPQEQVVNNVYGQFTGYRSCAVTYVETYTNDVGRNVVLIGGVCVVRDTKRAVVAATLKIIETTTASAHVIVTLRSLAPRALNEYELQVVYPQVKRFCHEHYANRVSEFLKRIFGSYNRKEKRR